jgi:hypothetical protein
MKTSEIKAGSKQRIKIGKNEVEVTVLGQKGKSWLVESATGKKFPVSESRFVKDKIRNKKLDAPIESVNVLQTEANANYKFSMLGAAIEVLKDALHPMSAKEMIIAMAEANLWKSPKGKTPWNSLASAINREIVLKENPRFKKAEKGKFILN